MSKDLEDLKAVCAKAIELLAEWPIPLYYEEADKGKSMTIYFPADVEIKSIDGPVTIRKFSYKPCILPTNQALMILEPFARRDVCIKLGMPK